jgi:hypothetical protein
VGHRLSRCRGGEAGHDADRTATRAKTLATQMNTSADQTHASLNRIADLMAERHAQLWINHDKPQSLGQKHSPEFYD